MVVPPEWVDPDARLSTDHDLRRQQLRWIADDIWMRRVVLCLVAMLPLAGAACFFVSPSLGTGLGVGTTALAALPLAYFFGRPARPEKTRRSRRLASNAAAADGR